MTRTELKHHSAAAVAATGTANDKNTSKSHKDAAAMHRIAANAADLAGDADAKTGHNDIAVQHDLAASRCAAAESNNVAVPSSSTSPDMQPAGTAALVTKTDAKDATPTAAVAAASASCDHMNSDGTFIGGFDGCVTHMQDACGGSHSEESAKKICGAIAAAKNAADAGGKHGMQAGGPGSGRKPGGYAEQAVAAKTASDIANFRSKAADASGDLNDRHEALKAHTEAENAHKSAAASAKSEGDAMSQKVHLAIAKEHAAARDKQFSFFKARDDSGIPGLQAATVKIKPTDTNMGACPKCGDSENADTKATRGGIMICACCGTRSEASDWMPTSATATSLLIETRAAVCSAKAADRMAKNGMLLAAVAKVRTAIHAANPEGHNQYTGGTSERITVHGRDAIRMKEKNPDVVLNKYNDPTEDHLENIDIGKANEVAKEDPNLVYAHVQNTGWTEGDGSGHEGYNAADYFRKQGTKLKYLGPDENGIEPTFGPHTGESNARGTGKRGLHASVSGGGYSLNDLQTSVREAISDVAVLNTASAGNGMGSCGAPWVCDVVAPADADDCWTAIVNGADGKLYAVDFEVDDSGGVTLDGDPEEVDKSTDYDYVNDILSFADAASKKGLESAGTTDGAYKGHVLKKTQLADMATEAANQASVAASDDPNPVTEEKAKSAHESAYDAHKDSYHAIMKAGATDLDVADHMNMAQKAMNSMQDHKAQAEFHQANVADLGARAANPTGFAALDASIRSAIEAGDYPGHPFRGNQYGAGNGGGMASKASENAHSATKDAKTASGHKAAAAAHQKAAKLQDKKGNSATADYHRMMANFHNTEAGGGKNGIAKESTEAFDKTGKAVKSDKPEDHKAAEDAHKKAATATKGTAKESKHKAMAEKHHSIGRIPASLGHSKKKKDKGHEASAASGASGIQGTPMNKTLKNSIKAATVDTSKQSDVTMCACPECGDSVNKDTATTRGGVMICGGCGHRSPASNWNPSPENASVTNAKNAKGKKGLEAGGPGSGRHKEAEDASKNAAEAEMAYHNSNLHGSSRRDSQGKLAALAKSASDAHFKAIQPNADAGNEEKSNFHGDKFSKLADAAFEHHMASVKAANAGSKPGIQAAATNQGPDEVNPATLSMAADNATKEAGQKSDFADDEDTAAAHRKAARAHGKAMDAHEDAYAAHSKADSNDTILDKHMAAMSTHKDAMADHNAQADELDACNGKRAADVKTCHNELVASGKNPTISDVVTAYNAKHSANISNDDVAASLSGSYEAPEDAYEEGAEAGQDAQNPYDEGTEDAQEWQAGYDSTHDDEDNSVGDVDLEFRNKKATDALNASAHAALECYGAASMEVKSIVTEDGTIMMMPAGTHTITPSQNGRPVTVTLDVDANSADNLERQRKALTANGKKPFFSIQHSSEKAGFWPSKFWYGKKVDATGKLAEGVWADGEWTASGKAARDGKDFRTFSPTFHVDAVRNDPSNPAQVICQEMARANMGALENDPAFTAMSPLWCRNSGIVPTPQKLESATVRAVMGVLGNNATLDDIVAVVNRNGFNVTADDVAVALR